MLPVLLALLALGGAPSTPSPAQPSAAEAARSTVRDSLSYYYAHQNVAAIQRLHRRAQTREDRLLCLYRLFPLTQNERLLTDIPAESSARTARELSLIAALWAYRTANAPVTRMPTYGRRSERILNQALSRDAQEPYALLVRGQSLLYKPRVFGGNPAEARRTFEQLRTVLARRSVPGIHPFEAEIWIWMAVRKTDEAAGRALQQQLLARRPPPLFRQFLTSPP
jgi:hypothetical protein